MSEWSEVEFAELCDITRGASPRPIQEWIADKGIPWVKISDASAAGSRYIEKTNECIRSEGQAKSVSVAPGDFILSNSATPGIPMLMKIEACIHDGWLLLRNFRGLDKLFAYYLLRHQRPLLVQQGNGSVFTNLKTEILKRHKVRIPSIERQHAIAHILGTLDDKIELNRRMNETLEAMARVIFKSWFVDFDPVRAKARDLIAEGVLQIGDGYRAKNEELGAEGVPFIRAGELNNGFDTAKAERLKLDRLPAATGKQSIVGDVAFTSKGTVGRFARVGEHTEPFVYSPQICFWRSLRPEFVHPAILYCWMQSGEFLAQIDGVAGQTDMAPYVSLRDQKAMEVPRFHESQAQVGEKIAPLLRLISGKQAESRNLANLRDTLLPKLLSGELPTTTEGTH